MLFNDSVAALLGHEHWGWGELYILLNPEDSWKDGTAF